MFCINSNLLDNGQESSWELFNLVNDPNEMNNHYNNPEYREIKTTLQQELQCLQGKFKDPVEDDRVADHPLNESDDRSKPH